MHHILIYGNAANTVVFPMTVIALALAAMISDGCCAFVSLCLGADNFKDANKAIKETRLYSA